ncbi:MAG: sulfatase-like hydrolase/transferase [Marinovum algicola]|uniref:Arylsulfatase A n=3 Tax=Marinovum algicola TaxID=42444 RepID=A0A975ZP02_9RHOB|nr:sulfatase-like hydrolase/transferase [Marinovum algicola]SEJ72158.1 Arylsulfatase A [Marinovum algicola]
MPDTRPNILFICTDQQRGDSLGCTGAGWAVSPNLDALAAEGALFRNCYVQNPVCSPSRASLFTGKYVANHGLYANGVPLAEDQRMFTKTLSEAGYDCGMIGKQHLAPCDTWRTEPRRDDGYRVFEWAHGPNHRALENDYHRWLRKTHPAIFARIFPDRGANENTEYSNQSRTGTPIDHVPKEAHYSHWVAERAIDFISHPRADAPFFLMANFFDPHHSFGAPQEFRDMIDADAIAPITTKPGELDEKPAPHRAYSEKSYSGTAPGFQEYTAEQIKEIRAQYWAMIALIDHEVGRILAALEVAGMAENTLVVFSSDHGEMLGNHQQLLKGPQLYDDLTRVPLIARWPREIAPGAEVSELVQWIDLPATFLAASGCAPAAGGQGASLLPLARGQAVDWRSWALCEYRYSGFATDPLIMTTMLRHGDWKLIVWHGEPACGTTRDGELYNLAEDPGELDNLYHRPEHAGQRRRMKALLRDAMAEAEDRSAPRARPW